MPMVTKGRNYLFDNIKFVLILLVVLGHVLIHSTDGAMRDGNIFFYLSKIIYSFHMPLFIFISGYFFRKKELQAFGKDILKLFKIYVIFELLQLAWGFLFMGYSLRLSLLLVPRFALWYILSLISWKVIFQFVPDKVVLSKFSVAASVVLSICVYMIHSSGGLAWQRTIGFMPFFLLGYYAKMFNVKLKGRKLLPMILLLLVGLTLAIVNKHFWASCTIGNYMDVIRRLSNVLAAIALCFSLVSLSSGEKNCISEYGKDTLFFYLYHPFPLFVFQYLISRFHLNFNFGFALAEFVAIMAILFVAKKIKLLNVPLK